MVVRDDDDVDLEDATRHASILQSKQLITNNVINKRKEQLQRWESSEMNAEPVHRRKNTRVKFQDSDIFLSACMSGDEEEVEELLAKGADINTATVDGLTALHQSVIDSKPDMVRFLCEKGADVNAQDNEGWTPLHAAACCGNLAIVKYLCQNGARLNVINSDKELALDLADDESCREYLERDYRDQGVIPEQCRDQELAIMMRDAQQWLRDGEYRDQPHRRTGATALHVAAAKGYTQLLELLIKAGGNIRAPDKDGWTPLHAAAHWAERDSCKILMEHGASITDTNYAGQNVLAVADKDVVEYLEDLERSVDKRKSPPSAPAGILQEKNVKSTHEEHTSILSAEHKRELKHKDQASENEILHSSVKLRKIEERSPSPPSESLSAQDASSNESQSTSPPVAVDEKLSSAERSASEPPSLPRTTQEASGERFSSTTRSTVSADRTIPSPVKPAGLIRTVNVPVSIADSAKLSDGSTSSIQSGDQHVSATVSIPARPFQQPNSWINRGVQLVSRSNSSSGSSGTRSSTAASSDSSSSPMSMSLATSSGSSVPYTGATPSVLSKPPPWQSSAVIESEAERRNTARMQRQHRRSTQGVTKEHLEEASRIAMAENARRRALAATQNVTTNVTSGSTPREAGMARLASEERDSTSMCSDQSSGSFEKGSFDESLSSRQGSGPREAPAMADRSSSERSQPASTTAAPLSLSSTTSSTNSTASGMRRKSQGLTVSRSNRRGTGPVLPEDIQAAVSVRQIPDSGANLTSSANAAPKEPASPAVRVSGTAASVLTRPPTSSVAPGRPDIVRSSEMTSVVNPVSQTTTAIRNVAPTAVVGRVQPRLPGQTIGNNAFSTVTSTINSRPTEMNLNYKALYEKEKLECERLRKEVEELKRSQEHGGSVTSLRTTTSRFRIGSPAGGPAPIAKSASGNSIDDGERRSLERKIADLEIQLKGLSQLRMENQRLKEENGALVRVISKMTI
ncbi:Ankyrin repeat protein [Trichostrongylus colubriformis]|uniref:Ankyrin repeat protein n=1 Tax=Trichostrongylus colubriformis TaxID=6319 RepID=A0AAN8IK02_TRICO